MSTTTTGETGIRRSPSSTNAWQAIVDGKLKVEFVGLGSRRLAAAAAGTDKELSNDEV
jgi:hypothetical protein